MTHGSTQGTVGGVGDQTRVSCMEDKLPNYFFISLAQKTYLFGSKMVMFLLKVLKVLFVVRVF